MDLARELASKISFFQSSLRSLTGDLGGRRDHASSLTNAFVSLAGVIDVVVKECGRLEKENEELRRRVEKLEDATHLSSGPGSTGRSGI